MRINYITLHRHFMICGYVAMLQMQTMSVAAREVILYTLHWHLINFGYVAITQMHSFKSVAACEIVSYTLHRNFIYSGYVAILQMQTFMSVEAFHLPVLQNTLRHTNTICICT
jgi:hypothetical protein